MVKKTSSAQRKRRSGRAGAGSNVRLREEFRSYARAVILEAGEEVMASQGLHAARMEEVAEKARVAVGTIYNLIGDRDALVAEIMRLRHEQVLALLSTTLERVQGLPFREQAQTCVVALVAHFREHRRFFRMVLESEGGPASTHKRLAQETHAKIRELFRELVSRGIAEGVLRADARELGGHLLIGMIRQLLTLDLETQPASTPEARAAEVLSFFVDGAGVK